MNDMPVPEGDYFALHAQRQRKYNTVLATGVCMNAFGLYMVSFSIQSFFHIFLLDLFS
jgi:hypothetical protein